MPGWCLSQDDAIDFLIEGCATTVNPFLNACRWLLMACVLCACFESRLVQAKDHFVILLPININQADVITLTRVLTGVGPKKAEAIVAYRQQHGEFQSIDDLAKVKGIGPGTLKKNRGRITAVATDQNNHL